MKKGGAPPGKKPPFDGKESNGGGLSKTILTSSKGVHVTSQPEIAVNKKIVHLQFLSKSEDGVLAERSRVLLPQSSMRALQLKIGSLVGLRLPSSSSSSSSSVGGGGGAIVALRAWPSAALSSSPSAAILNKCWSCNFDDALLKAASSNNKSMNICAELVRLDSKTLVIPIHKLVLCCDSSNTNTSGINNNNSNNSSNSNNNSSSNSSSSRVTEDCLLQGMLGLLLGDISSPISAMKISLATGGSYKQNIYNVLDILTSVLGVEKGSVDRQAEVVSEDGSPLPLLFEVTMSTIVVVLNASSLEYKGPSTACNISNNSSCRNGSNSSSDDGSGGKVTSCEAVISSMGRLVGGYQSQLSDLVFSVLLGLGLLSADTSSGGTGGGGSSGDNRIVRKIGLKGVLLSGATGTGKTLILRSLCAALGGLGAQLRGSGGGGSLVNVVEIKPDVLLSQTAGGSEAMLQRIFADAKRMAPSLIIIDDADIILKDRSKCSEAHKRLVSCALTLIDGVQSGAGDVNSKVVVLGASARPQLIDPALRRAGRFDREIELAIPSPNERGEILDVILGNRARIYRKNKSNDRYSTTSSAAAANIRSEVISAVAKKAHGMVGSDLLQVVKEAVLLTAKSNLIISEEDSDELLPMMAKLTLSGDSVDHMQNVPPTNSNNNGGSSSIDDVISIDAECMLQAVKSVSPSAIRDVAIEVPNVRWSDIGGMDSVKQSLKEVVEWPLLYPELFASIDMPPPRGVLLYGPPGCSKTLMAKALATESSMNFLAVKGPELLSKWLGESEKAVQTLFKRARQSAPSIIFFDEIDALAGKRGDSNSGVNDRVLSQLLTELDGIQGLKRVIVIAATNRPDLLDSALLRPGRVDRKIYVPPPDDESRRQILDLQLSRMPLAEDVNIETLVAMTKGFSGAEVVSLGTEAAFSVIERAVAGSVTAEVVNEEGSGGDSGGELNDVTVAVVTMADLSEAFRRTTPQITPTMINFYEKLRKDFEC